MRIVCWQKILMKYHALFVIFEKAAKFEIVVCCKLLVVLYGLKKLCYEGDEYAYPANKFLCGKYRLLFTSAAYIQMQFRPLLIIEVNTMNPDQTDLGPYC